jgi:hypothetical protein
MSMVRRNAWSWQASAIYTGTNERCGFGKNGMRVAVGAQRDYLSRRECPGNLFGGRLMQHIDWVGSDG